MQAALDEIISGDDLLMSALTQTALIKLKDQGVQDVEAHFEWIKSELGKRHRNENGLSWEDPIQTELIGIQGDYDLSFDSNDLEMLSERFHNAIKKSVEIASSEMYSHTFQVVRQQAIESVTRRAAELQEFRQRLAARWAKPLNLLALQIGISMQFGSDMSTWLRSHATALDAALIEALLRLHARACQIAGEVEVLLQNGFADGALSRWRSLHEVATVALFLQEHGNDVAERYLDHLTIDSYDLARKVRAASKNSEADISEEELNKILLKVAALRNKYGVDFSEEYGWAAKALNNKRPNFSQIEKSINLEKFRPYYKLASTAIHAGPKGAYWKLGLINQDMLLAGPSNAGLAEAGRLAAISISQVSAVFLPLHTVIDSTVWVRIILELSSEIELAFLKAEKNLEQDEEKNNPSPKTPEKISARLRRRQGK